MANAQRRAHAALSALLPPISPWVEAALFAPYRMPGALPELGTDELDDILALRLGPLLLNLLEQVERDGRLQADLPGAGAEVIETLRSYRVLGELRTRALLAKARHAANLLESHGITLAVSKGPGIARHYPDPRLRPYHDIDLLVPERHFATARTLLADHGWASAPQRREQRQYFERLCREAVNLELGELGRVDIHHHIPPWLWGSQLTTETLIERAEPVSTAGYRFPVLDAVDNFIVSCLHIVSDRSEPGRSLVVWRDIIELGRVAGVDAIGARGHRLGLLGWIGAVVNSLPADVRPFPVPARWAVARIDHPRRLSVMLNHGDPGRPIRRHLARLPAVPNAVAYAAGVTIPSHEFLDSHVDGSLKLLRWVSNRRVAR